jgi:hypothetical protein
MIIKWFPFESPFYCMDDVKMIMIIIITIGGRKGEFVVQEEYKK